MPENENKTVSQQRQEEMDKGKLKKVAPIDTSSLQTDDLTKAAFNQQQTQNKADETSEAISNAYYSPMQQLGVWASERQEAKKKLQEQDETAQRQASNLKMIAGISDGLASLANLIGVADRGSNIDMGTGALTPLQQKLEAARLERKADIKSIDDRLDQYKNQMLKMQLAKGNAVAQQKATEAERAEKRAAELRGYAHSTNLAKMQIDAAAKAREENNKHEAEMTEMKIQSSERTARKDRESKEAIAGLKQTSGGNKNPFVFEDLATGQKKTINIPNQSLLSILNTYLPTAVKNGDITEDEAEKVMEYTRNSNSPTMLMGLVNKSQTLQDALKFAVGETDGVPTGGYTPQTINLWGQQDKSAYPAKGWMVNDDGTEKYNKTK